MKLLLDHGLRHAGVVKIGARRMATARSLSRRAQLAWRARSVSGGGESPEQVELFSDRERPEVAQVESVHVHIVHIEDGEGVFERRDPVGERAGYHRDCAEEDQPGRDTEVVVNEKRVNEVRGPGGALLHEQGDDESGEDEDAAAEIADLEVVAVDGVKGQVAELAEMVEDRQLALHKPVHDGAHLRRRRMCRKQF